MDNLDYCLCAVVFAPPGFESAAITLARRNTYKPDDPSRILGDYTVATVDRVPPEMGSDALIEIAVNHFESQQYVYQSHRRGGVCYTSGQGDLFTRELRRGGLKGVRSVEITDRAAPVEGEELRVGKLELIAALRQTLGRHLLHVIPEANPDGTTEEAIKAIGTRAPNVRKALEADIDTPADLEDPVALAVQLGVWYLERQRPISQRREARIDPAHNPMARG